MVMSKVSTLVSKDIGNYLTNRSSWNIFYNAKAEGLAGDGTTDDFADLSTLINTTINGAEATIIFSPGTYKISTSITIPSNINLFITKGAMLSPDSGKTITINGPLDAGNYQIFTGAGTILGMDNIPKLYPQWFSGTDFEQIQAALDLVIVNYNKVYISADFDITGNSNLMFNKASGSWDTDRRKTYVVGEGGSITKNDSGNMFSSPFQLIGDINFEGVRFFSTSGAGMNIFDCDKLIRIEMTDCQCINVDRVAYAPNTFFQSNRFTRVSVSGGAGLVYEARQMIDTTFLDCSIEARVSGIGNTVGLAEVQNIQLRIENCLFQGLSGTAIKLGSCYGTTITRSYFEANQVAHIDLLSLDMFFNFGVEISNNYFKMTATQLAAFTPAVNWGAIYSGSGTAVSISNTVNGLGGVLHKVKASEGGRILGMGDNASTLITGGTGFAVRYIQLSRVTTVGTFNSIIKWGPMTSQNVVTPISLTSNQRKFVDFVVDVPPLAGDVVTISFTNSINIRKDGEELVANAYRVYFTNLQASVQTADVTMSVLKLFNA